VDEATRQPDWPSRNLNHHAKSRTGLFYPLRARPWSVTHGRRRHSCFRSGLCFVHVAPATSVPWLEGLNIEMEWPQIRAGKPRLLYPGTPAGRSSRAKRATPRLASPAMAIPGLTIARSRSRTTAASVERNHRPPDDAQMITHRISRPTDLPPTLTARRYAFRKQGALSCVSWSAGSTLAVGTLPRLRAQRPLQPRHTRAGRAHRGRHRGANRHQLAPTPPLSCRFSAIHPPHA